MAIKMRVNTKLDCTCQECNRQRKEVLDMFDVCVAGNIFTICDVCNEALFYKTLRAENYKNGRIKSKHDMSVINERGRKKWEAKEKLKNQLNTETVEVKDSKEDKQFKKQSRPAFADIYEEDEE